MKTSRPADKGRKSCFCTSCPPKPRETKTKGPPDPVPTMKKYTDILARVTRGRAQGLRVASWGQAKGLDYDGLVPRGVPVR